MIAIWRCGGASSGLQHIEYRGS